MPSYEYECTECKKQVTQLRPYSEMNTEKPCPEKDCKGVLKKLLLNVGRVISYNVPL